METKTIYAILGFNRSGKTTIGRILGRRLTEAGYRISYLPFGEILKRELTDQIPWVTREWIDEKSPEVRALMRSYGDAVRSLDHCYFVDLWRSQVERSDHDIVIVDDVYHVNEFEEVLMLDDHIPVLLHVDRFEAHPNKSDMSYQSVRQSVDLSYLFPRWTDKVYYHEPSRGSITTTEAEALFRREPRYSDRYQPDTLIDRLVNDAWMMLFSNTCSSLDDYEHYVNEMIPNLFPNNFYEEVV